LDWDNTVSKKAQAVQSIGQPINASTNRGLKTREFREVGSPSVGIVGPRGEWNLVPHACPVNVANGLE
jgi:hypothetical protein